MGDFHYAEALIVCYINLICVTCVIGAIMWRSFDPAFILGQDTEVEEVELPQAPAYYTPTPSAEATLLPTPLGTTDSPYLRAPSPFDRERFASFGSTFRGSTVDLGPIST